MHTASNTKKYQLFAAVQCCLGSTPLTKVKQILVTQCTRVDVKIPTMQEEQLTMVNKNNSHCSKVGCHCGNKKNHHENFMVCPVVTMITNKSNLASGTNATLGSKTNTPSIPQYLTANNNSAELLRWLQRLNHISFRKLKLQLQGCHK